MRRNTMGLAFSKGDVAAIVLVVLLALSAAAVFRMQIQPGDNSKVQIYQDGELIREMSLEKDMDFTVQGKYSNKVQIQDSQAAIVESDCPGTDCVHSGWIKEAGRSIICLPNRVEVRIGGASEVDFVVR